MIDSIPDDVDLDAIAQKWIKICLCTDPIDRERAKAAVCKAYECAGLKPPEEFIFLDSPMAGAIAASMFSFHDAKSMNLNDGVDRCARNLVKDQVIDHVWNQVADHVMCQIAGYVLHHVRAQVWDQIRSQVWDQASAQVWHQARALVGDRVENQVEYMVRDQIWDQVWAQVWDQVWAQVRDKVWAQVLAHARDKVWDQIRSEVWDQIVARIWDMINKAIYGHCDASLAAYYSDAMKKIGVIGMELFDGIAETVRECGWIWPFERLAIITDRPCEIHMEDGRLHNECGPAIMYRDGFSAYAWRGMRVPAEWIEKRESLQASDILKEKNVELRAVGMEIIGWDKAMEQLNCRVIDDSGDPDIGKLVEMELPGIDKPGRFLVAECPRNGRIVEGVPYVSDIDGKPIDTVIAAQAWRIGDPQDEYIHPERRT